jgi:hypothetical protein
MRRGRPVGSSKLETRTESVVVRLDQASRAWLAAAANAAGITESQLVRRLIDERVATSSKEDKRMRGFNQVGHDAVVVWSPTHQAHVHDVQVQITRGCRTRPGGFQQTPTGLFYTWLDAPADRCDLCGGRCRYR